MYASSCWKPWWPSSRRRCCSSEAASGPRSIASMAASIQACKRGASSRGTPRTSQITVTGRGYANASTASIRVLPFTLSRRLATMRWISGIGRAEVSHECTAHAIVVGWVHSEHARCAHVRRGRLAHRFGRGRLGAVSEIRADPGVLEQGDDLPIRADDIAAVRLPRHRGFPEFGVEGIRIGPVGILEGLLPGGFLGHDAPLLSVLWAGTRFGPRDMSAAWRSDLSPAFTRVMAGQDDLGHRRGDARVRKLGWDRLHVPGLIEARRRGWERRRALDQLGVVR